jgi:hypothetical protein
MTTRANKALLRRYKVGILNNRDIYALDQVGRARLPGPRRLPPARPKAGKASNSRHVLLDHPPGARRIP